MSVAKVVEWLSDQVYQAYFVIPAVAEYPASLRRGVVRQDQTLNSQQTGFASSREFLDFQQVRFSSVSGQGALLIAMLARHVLKTNFYQPTKVALSFRLAPDFLPEVEYPRKPFGMFFVIGNEFRGFHIRFKDVARGGIRIVLSRNKEWV